MPAWMRPFLAVVTGFAVPLLFTPIQTNEVVLVGAGDIASCESDASEATARLLDGIEGMVFTLGDNVLQHGSADEYANCYDPTWGRHKERTRPVPGNHDYDTPGASGYFEYFGESAGNPGEGWYAFDHGSWRIIALNTNCGEIGGCDARSPQLAWLEAELSDNSHPCTLAYMHHPRFTSTPSGDDADLDAMWEVLYDHGAEIVLSGHAHTYERFSPMDPEGNHDPAGIVQFVAGTGGNDLHAFDRISPHSESRNDQVHGVLRLTLKQGDYDWAFVPAGPGEFNDEGSGSCH